MGNAGGQLLICHLHLDQHFHCIDHGVSSGHDRRWSDSLSQEIVACD